MSSIGFFNPPSWFWRSCIQSLSLKLDVLCWTWVKHSTWLNVDICLTCCCNVNSHTWHGTANPMIGFLDSVVLSTVPSYPMEEHPFFLYSGKWCVAGWNIVPYLVCCIQQLLSLGTVCHWKGLLGCLCYADDLALLAPSAHVLRRMLKICSDLLPKGIWCSMPERLNWYMFLPT